MSLTSVFVLLLLLTVCVWSLPQLAPPLPRLRIDTQLISISGISSGADFTVQFHVAFSDMLMGAGIFAGEPFHCAVTRFEEDPPTLPYDHCKIYPNWVNVTILAEYAKEQEKQATISPLNNLLDDFIYLYRGTKDTVYHPGSVKNTGDFYKLLLKTETQIHFEDSIPSLHCIPTVDYGTPCGTEGDPPGIEKCNYDGAGVCLSHIYQNIPLKPPGTASDDNLFEYDQRLYFSPVFPGLADVGWIYIPLPCQAPSTSNPCKLHIFFHGCSGDYSIPQFNFTYIKHAGFNSWAESNEIVVLYPQMGGYHNGTKQQLGGCWDSYGDTGEDYCLKSGVQMTTVRKMINAIAGV